MNLLSSTLTTVGDELNEVVNTIDDLKRLYYDLVDDINNYPFNNNKGVAGNKIRYYSNIKRNHFFGFFSRFYSDSP